MVQTEKYKKEIIGIIKKAKQLNSFIGDYVIHYLNERAQFTVLLSNGSLEIEIEAIRAYGQNSTAVFPAKLRRDIEFYVCAESQCLRGKSLNSKWNQLFGREG
jgi:hypothetical protein